MLNCCGDFGNCFVVVEPAWKPCRVVGLAGGSSSAFIHVCASIVALGVVFVLYVFIYLFCIVVQCMYVLSAALLVPLSFVSVSV